MQLGCNGVVVFVKYEPLLLFSYQQRAKGFDNQDANGKSMSICILLCIRMYTDSTFGYLYKTLIQAHKILQHAVEYIEAMYEEIVPLLPGK